MHLIHLPQVTARMNHIHLLQVATHIARTGGESVDAHHNPHVEVLWVAHLPHAPTAVMSIRAGASSCNDGQCLNLWDDQEVWLPDVSDNEARRSLGSRLEPEGAGLVQRCRR